MKPHLRLLVAELALTLSAAAIAAPPVKSDLPPPPGLHEPTAASTPQAPAESAATAAPVDDPLAPLPKPDARLVRDKASRDASPERVAASEVTKRLQGKDTVEEYRQNGHLWMIKIIPVTGPTQTFLANDGSGRLVRDPKEGPVSPVYYSLYEWK
jgi:hypothetical protein